MKVSKIVVLSQLVAAALSAGVVNPELKLPPGTDVIAIRYEMEQAKRAAEEARQQKISKAAEKLKSTVEDYRTSILNTLGEAGAESTSASKRSSLIDDASRERYNLARAIEEIGVEVRELAGASKDKYSGISFLQSGLDAEGLVKAGSPFEALKAAVEEYNRQAKIMTHVALQTRKIRHP
jgi:hypothetical protein